MKHIVDRNAQTLVPGLILYSSWGYDQTNIDFYIVTAVKGQFATVCQIEAPEKATDIMFGTVYPILPVKLKGPALKRKMRGTYVRLTNYSAAFPWDGEPKDCSHTH